MTREQAIDCLVRERLSGVVRLCRGFGVEMIMDNPQRRGGVRSVVNQGLRNDMVIWPSGNYYWKADS